MKILEEVLSRKEHCIELRRYFHMHPEVSFKEYNTANKIEEELDRMNIEHYRVGETGICAIVYGNNPGKTLALRADIDALPISEKNNKPYKSVNEGVMHACGHDGHTATLLTALDVLKDLEFDGEMRFFFQQAEEHGAGARQFVQAGWCEDVDRIVGYHGWSNHPVGTVSCTPGPVMASCDYFKIHVHGKSAHVSVPHEGIDALYIGSQIVTALQGIVARKVAPLDTVIVGIGKMVAGTAYNIVAQDAILEGTTRSFTPETRKMVNDSVVTISKSIAEAYGATCEVTFSDYSAPVVNNEEVAKEMEEVASLFADKVITNEEKRLGADDYADYLLEVPGMYMFVGTRSESDSDTWVAQHNDHYDIDENSMLLAASILVSYARKFFNSEI